MAVTVVGLRPDAYIVAEVRDPGEMGTVIRFTGGDQLETIHSNDLNTRVALTAIKQPGITRAFEEILGFGQLINGTPPSFKNKALPKYLRL